ncbi:MAG: T9SS type A sorting domain-containing protein, partial [Candidatus Cloacimonetes bacterium]|nr:T9SS type A sorting domain-containing protein [Candidatus Cloacimonadota bacterium]
PNPITAKTNKVSISFALKKSSRVNIKLYNIKGQLVDEILNDNEPSGTHTITSSINNLSSGIYFIKMDVDGKNRAVKKMVKIE